MIESVLKLFRNNEKFLDYIYDTFLFALFINSINSYGLEQLNIYFPFVVFIYIRFCFSVAYIV